mmetsp:Transcript_10230/g.12411  ORF Transcript_10230/g.12411 Transcript_10230/m.12411 type:complete len:295 (+) Transcript_10230:96-980(+)|eukprot:CAMPEP_0114358156 /NCGR_PEP_ID=MMETSP0101-20121206/22114_1 /TAXON_ID=38822 ORGANISM="Pteridomonas danica, Strain PT" /NCGR_SAMPLE_ID=MMETSP0101 /ASSEMBLY_ACC=CAM_ASM_000211 /LENGTH=294 /DNA_ID=CAMNT_0001501175 /DNA_START=78 /DNA_END=962 /DNA_ORIENTATION=-
MSSDRGAQFVKYSGTTTQFDDVLIEKGIITKEQALLAQGMDVDSVAEVLVKEKLEEMGFFDETIEQDKTKKEIIQETSLNKLDELEDDDDFDDESFLQQYREQRMAELKIKQSSEIFGSVHEISKSDWIREVNEASKNFWVVCHLYADHVEACSHMSTLLIRFASKFRHIKCLSIKATSAVENYPDNKVPALFIYHNGELQHQVITMDGMYGMKTRDCDLEWLFAQFNVIETDLETCPNPPTSVTKTKGADSVNKGEGGRRNVARRRYLNGDKDEDEQEDEEDIDEYGNGNRPF